MIIPVIAAINPINLPMSFVPFSFYDLQLIVTLTLEPNAALNIV